MGNFSRIFSWNPETCINTVISREKIACVHSDLVSCFLVDEEASAATLEELEEDLLDRESDLELEPDEEEPLEESEPLDELKKID